MPPIKHRISVPSHRLGQRALQLRENGRLLKFHLAEPREPVVLPLPDDASPDYLWFLATDPLGLDPFVGMAIVHHPNIDDLTIRYLTRSASRPEGMSLKEWRAWQGRVRKDGER